MALEDREDKQAAKKEEIVLQGDTDIRVNTATSAAQQKHGMLRDQNNIEQESLHKPELEY